MCRIDQFSTSTEEDLEIQHAIENWPYTCKSAIFLQEYNLFNKVFIQKKIGCKTLIEFTYYSC